VDQPLRLKPDTNDPDRASGDGLNGYGFGTADGGRLVFTSFSRHDYFTMGVTVLPNQWQYVGVVVDASNDPNFYVNGSLVGTVAGTFQTQVPATNFTFGNQSPGPGHTDEIFTGGLAGISVYKTALTPAQIQAQYNAAIIPEPSSLVLIGLVGAGCTLRRRRRKASSSVPR
jgi:Concanavalin A-like lectin/glucanases superfamily/PEP-CTERM motif